jgi:hypothetical protein
MAIPRAQAAELAKQEGVSSPMVLAEIENQIGNGKTPEQAVKSYMENNQMATNQGSSGSSNE